MRVTVIGAGIAGLATADRLLEKGCTEVRVLERAPYHGGLARSEHRDAYTFDLGPHQFHTDDEKLVAFVSDLLDGALLQRDKRSGQFFRNRYLNYPLGVNDLLTRLPIQFSMLCFLDFCKEAMMKPFRGKQDDSSFESWVTHRFGRRMYEAYFKPYTRKVWGRDPATLSSFCAEERIAVQSLFHVLISVLTGGATRFGKSRYFTHTPYTDHFYYPEGGTGRIADAFAARIRDKGGLLITDVAVQALRQNGQSWEAHTDDGQVYVSDAVAATLPPTVLRDLLPGDSKPDDRLTFRGLTFLFLAANRSPGQDHHWIYFPDEDCPFQRVTDFSRFSGAMAPSGHHAICLEFPCDAGDVIWQSDAKDLLKMATPYLENCGYLSANDVTEAWVVRESHAYPVYDLHYAEAMKNLTDYISGFDGIYTIGRQARFSYIDVNDIIPMAHETADRILADTSGGA